MADHCKLIDRLTSSVSTLKETEEHVDTRRNEDPEEEIKVLYPSTRGGARQSSATVPSNPYRPSHHEAYPSSRSTSEAQVTHPANPAPLMSQDGARAYRPGHGKRCQTQRSKFGQRRGSKMLKSGDGTGKMRGGDVKPNLNKKTDSITKDVSSFLRVSTCSSVSFSVNTKEVSRSISLR